MTTQSAFSGNCTRVLAQMRQLLDDGGLVVARPSAARPVNVFQDGRPIEEHELHGDIVPVECSGCGEGARSLSDSRWARFPSIRALCFSPTALKNKSMSACPLRIMTVLVDPLLFGLFWIVSSADSTDFMEMLPSNFRSEN